MTGGATPTDRTAREREALLHDLVLGGVQVEVGATPADWRRPARPAAPAPQPPSQTASRAAPVASEVPPARRFDTVDEPRKAPKAPIANVELAEAPPVRKVVEVPAQAQGEPGGVVVVCVNAPGAAESELLHNMLKALNLHEKPRCVVWGNSGLAACIAAQNPAQVLLLGQATLGALLDKTLGVEEWHREKAALPLDFTGPVGVTYPLDLMLKNPLYKKRAWQHLLRWI